MKKTCEVGIIVKRHPLRNFVAPFKAAATVTALAACATLVPVAHTSGGESQIDRRVSAVHQALQNKVTTHVVDPRGLSFAETALAQWLNWGNWGNWNNWNNWGNATWQNFLNY
jgi:hypothetical protein